MSESSEYDDSGHYVRQAVALSRTITDRLGAEFLEGDGEAALGLIDSPVFGRFVAFDIDGVTYTLDHVGDLLAIRAHGGGSEFATIDADGNYGSWRRQAPPAGQAAQN